MCNQDTSEAAEQEVNGDINDYLSQNAVRVCLPCCSVYAGRIALCSSTMDDSVTPSHRLQADLRQRQQDGSYTLPELERWDKGIPFWGEIVSTSQPEAEQWRASAPRLSCLPGDAPQQGIQLCCDGPDLNLRLASQINDTGYGGLVQFEDLAHDDCFLRILVGGHMYPVIVDQALLKDFWTQLMLKACRHFLTVIDQGICLGFWESDVTLRR